MSGFGLGSVGFVGSLGGGAPTASGDVPPAFYVPGNTVENDGPSWTFSPAGAWQALDPQVGRYTAPSATYMEPGVAGLAVLDKPVRATSLKFNMGGIPGGNRLRVEVRPYTAPGTGTWAARGILGQTTEEVTMPTASGYYEVRVGNSPSEPSTYTVLDLLTIQ